MTPLCPRHLYLVGGVAYLLGTVSVTPSLGSSRVYKTLGADPATLGLTALAAGWSCRCVTHHHGGSIGDRLILLPPQHSLPLALCQSYCCGSHYPHQQGAGTTIVGFITLSLCWSSGPAIMGVTTYVLLLRLWFRHIGVGLIMLSWGSLRRHWAGPAVLWFTKSAAGWYLHRRVPYLIVVLDCHVGAGLAWVSGSDFCHWAHLLLMGVPHPLGNPVLLGFYQHLILNSIVGVAGVSGGVTIEISPHPSMRGRAGRKHGVIGYEHGQWWWGERKQ